MQLTDYNIIWLLWLCRCTKCWFCSFCHWLWHPVPIALRGRCWYVWCLCFWHFLESFHADTCGLDQEIAAENMNNPVYEVFLRGEEGRGGLGALAYSYDSFSVVRLCLQKLHVFLPWDEAVLYSLITREKEQLALPKCSKFDGAALDYIKQCLTLSILDNMSASWCRLDGI